MRRLLLLRHAKAERARPGERDHERTLAERGRRDAPRLGAYLSRHGLEPDHVVVSTSTRTRETWELVAEVIGGKPSVSFEERIYEASPQALLQVVRETKARAHVLLMVGHNPGMQELATLLVATGDVEARQQMKEAFPTAALAVIDFKLDGWDKVHAQGGRLEHFIVPRSIAEETD